MSVTLTAADLVNAFRALDAAVRDVTHANASQISARVAALETEAATFGTMLSGFAFLNAAEQPAGTAGTVTGAEFLAASRRPIVQGDPINDTVLPATVIPAQAARTWGPGFAAAADAMAEEHATGLARRTARARHVATVRATEVAGLRWADAVAQAGIGAQTGVVTQQQIDVAMAADLADAVEAPVVLPRTSRHVGQPGERGLFESLLLTRCFRFPSHYADGGRGWGYEFRDEDDNVIVAMVTRPLQNGDGLEIDADGDTYAIRATIKRHDVRNGTRQTIINRCEVIAG